MIVAQISDTHIALDVPDGARRIDDFERTIADINALDPAPDVIVHTGDIAHNGRADEYAEAARIVAGAKPPVYVIPGNKDDRANLRAAFAGCGYIGRDSEFIDYAVEDHPIRLIAVDTKSAQSNKGDFCDARAKRLIDMIDAETTKPIVVITHHPPFEVPVGPDALNFVSEDKIERIRNVLQHSHRVVAVLSGHVHRGTAGCVGTARAVVVPCIATNLRRGDYPPSMKRRPVYHLYRFDPDGSFAAEARIVAAEPSLEPTSPPPVLRHGLEAR